MIGRRLTEWRERRAAESARVRGGVAPTVRPLHRGTYEGATAGPVAKPGPYRDATLLEMARGRPCLVMVPGLCSHRVDTVVAAHSNSQEHGKGMGRKADDCYTAFACVACHSWLDQGKAAGEVRESAFMAAHARQVLAWRLIAMDPNEPARYRAAARRALDRLGATPLTEEA